MQAALKKTKNTRKSVRLELFQKQKNKSCSFYGNTSVSYTHLTLPTIYSV